MANEITIRSGFNINNVQSTGSLQYGSLVQGFQKTQRGLGGPTPGMLLVTLAGVEIILSQLSVPGLMEVYNLDATNYVTIGIKTHGNNVFYPFLEVGPGEDYCIPLSRFLCDDWTKTGTGTPSGATNKLWAEANTASCKVIFNVFEA